MASKALLPRALAHWPHDALRPTAQLGAVLSTRLLPQTPSTDTTSSTAAAVAAASEQESNAILSLLTDKFARRYALPPPAESRSGGIMAPRSNPEYYRALVRDLDELPSRTWAQRLRIRLGGMFRWS